MRQGEIKMYSPQHILSENKKCDVSLNLPRSNCTPTKICAFCCYGRRGPINWGYSTRKQQWFSDYLAGSDISELVRECRRYTAVRLAGTGDLLLSHLDNCFKLAKACPATQFWGMTRKTDIAREINGCLPNLSLLVSVDASSPASTWDYRGKLCFGPRRAQDTVPVDSRIITVFPYHLGGKVVQGIPRHKKDCKAVYHEITGCSECGRCWKW